MSSQTAKYLQHALLPPREGGKMRVRKRERKERKRERKRRRERRGQRKQAS
jgi:hypothetical protein